MTRPFLLPSLHASSCLTFLSMSQCKHLASVCSRSLDFSPLPGHSGLAVAAGCCQQHHGLQEVQSDSCPSYPGHSGGQWSILHPYPTLPDAQATFQRLPTAWLCREWQLKPSLEPDCGLLSSAQPRLCSAERSVVNF